MRIPTLQRYLARQIWAAVTFVLVGFLALFAFFDLIAELRDLGKGDYACARSSPWSCLAFPRTPTS
jgi:lipopolysaccharide export system permease protein